MTAPTQENSSRPEVEVDANPLRRTGLWVGGVVSTALGFVGIFVPGLPTTPFLILAGWCFARSSPRLHAWLLSNRFFGPSLRQWGESRTIPLRAKRQAVVVVLLTFGVSIAVVDAAWQRLLLLVIGTIVLLFTLRLRTRN